VIHRCRSVALQYRRFDGGTQEAHDVTTVTPIKNGPLLVIGDIEVSHEDGTVESLPRATLCRCGESLHKPFCDNEHLRINFKAPGVALKIHLTPVRPRTDEPIAKADDPRG
jgi:CDGSH-type Zn-finger protein